MLDTVQPLIWTRCYMFYKINYTGQTVEFCSFMGNMDMEKQYCLWKRQFKWQKKFKWEKWSNQLERVLSSTLGSQQRSSKYNILGGFGNSNCCKNVKIILEMEKNPSFRCRWRWSVLKIFPMNTRLEWLNLI